MLLHGDCLDWLACLEDNSIDALVTDPPAGISFMGKAWDHHKGGRLEWIEWMASVMRECLRVMKPGAHGLVWALPRTSHWTATALEEAGFEVRDVVTHHFGSGFPKSMNVSIAIDKAAGAIGSRGKGFNAAGQNVGLNQNKELRSDHPDYIAPGGVTDDAKTWRGWGTALKPASEHWILIRKPCSEKTVAANVLKWGTGALNIDASRIAGEPIKTTIGGRKLNGGKFGAQSREVESVNIPWENSKGRFPANLVFSCPCDNFDQHELGCAVGELDAQSGSSADNLRVSRATKLAGNGNTLGVMKPVEGQRGFADSGGASRFFYVAKISKAERNAGLSGLEPKRAPLGDDRPERMNQNTHPTVKPQKLMRYLITMVTPPGGTVLDPFMGSGSTGVAARALGFRFTGIEKERDYFKIAKKRIQNGSNS